MGKNSTTLEFIQKANKIHDNLFIYSLTHYINSRTKVKIICKEHGIFEQTPNDHLNGCGCEGCKREKTSKRWKKYSLDLNRVIQNVNLIHKNKYDYSLVVCKNQKSKVKIICKEHGIFEQTLNAHLQGQQCPKCVGGVLKTLEQFINDAKIIHGNLYNYDLVNYKNNQTKIKIICKIHGEFEQSPMIHLMGSGCQCCNLSKGILQIIKWLNEKKINFIKEYKIKECMGKRKSLPFDLYLNNYNILIEYDGKQHFEPVSFNGMTEEKAKETFNKLKINDNIKNEYCKNNNIRLVRISYKENIINRLDELELTKEKIL